MAEIEDHFTLFVKLPFPRGDFVDPPPVAWSAAKERDLWEVLSKSSKGHEIDWKDLSDRFQVSQAFLLQQAAWLYERQLSQVRAQMRRMGTARSSNTASPLPQSSTPSVAGAQLMRRTGSGGSRVPSRLSSQLPIAENTAPATPPKPRSSFAGRTTLQGATDQTRPDIAVPRPLSRRTSKDNEVTSKTLSRRGSIQHQLTRSPKQDLQEVESSSEEEMTQSRLLHRRPNPAASRRVVPGRKMQHTRRPSAPQLDEEDEEESPAFLPFFNNSTENAKAGASTTRESGATLRGGSAQSSRLTAYRRTTSDRAISQQAKPEGNLTSSASSASENTNNPPRPRTSEVRQQGRGHLPNPLSPQQQATLAAAAGLSPRLRRAGNQGGHGSDTSPSMGSSFSDLDDASVTQSALEEALLSGMGNTTMTVGGGPTSGAVNNVANRVSGISQALRSRYFDARGGEPQR